MPALGIFGGTFDPIHYGHLRPALEVLESLQLEEVRFIPCRVPVHRGQPQVTPEQRLALLRLVLADQPGLVADDQELRRATPSYMVDTLLALRAEVGAQVALCLLIGSDAFQHLPTWWRWTELTDLAHIVVMQRPGSRPAWSEELESFVADKLTQQPQQLRQQTAGKILLHPVTQLDISATALRQRLAVGQAVRYLLPDIALAYIQDHRLYQAPHAGCSCSNDAIPSPRLGLI